MYIHSSDSHFPTSMIWGWRWLEPFSAQSARGRPPWTEDRVHSHPHTTLIQTGTMDIPVSLVHMSLGWGRNWSTQRQTRWTWEQCAGSTQTAGPVRSWFCSHHNCNQKSAEFNAILQAFAAPPRSKTRRFLCPSFLLLVPADNTAGAPNERSRPGRGWGKWGGSTVFSPETSDLWPLTPPTPFYNKEKLPLKSEMFTDVLDDAVNLSKGGNSETEDT